MRDLRVEERYLIFVSIYRSAELGCLTLGASNRRSSARYALF